MTKTLVVINDQHRVSPIAFGEATTAFISQAKVASGAAFNATLSACLVFITSWHLKDNENSFAVSKIAEMLREEVAKVMPKAKKSWSYQLVADGKKLATKLCYKGDKPQYAGVIHDIVECHSPQSALEALQAWAKTEAIENMEQLSVYVGSKKAKSGKARAAAAAAKAAKAGEGKLTGDITSDLAIAKVAIEHTDDSVKRAQMAEDVAFAVAISVPDKLITARALFEEMTLDDLDSVEKMLRAIIDRKLTESTAAKDTKTMTKAEKAAAKLAAKEAQAATPAQVS